MAAIVALDSLAAQSVGLSEPKAVDPTGFSATSLPTGRLDPLKTQNSRCPVDDVSAMLGTWIVGRVRPRNEHAVSERLAVQGFGAYVPLVRRGNGSRERVVPVFPQYAFACGEPDALHYAMKADANVFELIPVHNQRQFSDELSGVQQAIRINPNLGVTERLVVGAMVQVVRVDHPFRGFIGVIEYSGDKFRPHLKLIVGMRMLGRGVQVEIDASDVEPVDN